MPPWTMADALTDVEPDLSRCRGSRRRCMAVFLGLRLGLSGRSVGHCRGTEEVVVVGRGQVDNNDQIAVLGCVYIRALYMEQ